MSRFQKLFGRLPRPASRMGGLGLLVLAALLPGCQTPPPKDTDVHDEKVLKQFLTKPDDPRRYSLTVYESPYGPVFAGSKRLHGGQFADAAFISPRTSSMPLIRVRGRAKEDITALVDTSSRDSWITLDGAALVYGRPLGPRPFTRAAVHTAEASMGYAGYASKLIIDPLQIEDMIFYLRIPQVTLGPLARGAEDPRPEIVLGCDLLRQFAFVRLDYPERKLYFSSDKPYTGDPDALLANEPYKIFEGSLSVDAVIDGVATQLIIDCAGDYELAWNKPEGAPLRQLSIGDLVIRQIEPSNSEALGLGFPDTPRIGYRLLRRFALVISNRERRLLIERPSRYKAPDVQAEDERFTKPKPFDWDAAVGN